LLSESRTTRNAHRPSRRGHPDAPSKGIARKLRRQGATLISRPESFLVTTDNHLEPDEEARARNRGARLGSSLDETIGCGALSR
jgi:hypothetical protein